MKNCEILRVILGEYYEVVRLNTQLFRRRIVRNLKTFFLFNIYIYNIYKTFSEFGKKYTRRDPKVFFFAIYSNDAMRNTPKCDLQSAKTSTKIATHAKIWLGAVAAPKK
eukprot:GEMP01092838.1.p1 GENE.GEMP01092838.1~~GEMP01092838.1.p1  ORF type:complete len:109 (+),score=1.24 GEMP01092838.1:309-635(+)